LQSEARYKYGVCLTYTIEAIKRHFFRFQ
jgi:hypothetical protein